MKYNTVKLIFHYEEIKMSNLYKSASLGYIGNLKQDKKEYKIYSVWVKTLLFWDNNKFIDKKQTITLNTHGYRQSFINGYEKGQQHFIDKYENNKFATHETIVDNIMHLHKKVSTELLTDQLVISDKVFNIYGYHSGIYTEMLRFEEINKGLFNLNFDTLRQSTIKPKPKLNEIPTKVKALFKFIEYLHSNIDSFKKYDEVINELHLLDKERQKVTPRKNFADKLKYDEVQAKIEDKFKVIQENIIKLIQAKATELNICNLNKTETLWNWNISEISNLKENFSKKDLPEIFRHKRKYLEYRTKTNCTYFQDFFFNDLDEILKELFDYFKETKQNEFEHFEAKSLQVNSFEEAIKEIQKGHSKFTLPNNFLSNRSNIQQPKNEPLSPQPMSIEENRTNKKINELFEVMDNKGYKYAFMTEQDYNTFTDILTNFFELKEYKLPKVPIQLKRNCKTKLAATLGKIHSELSNVDKFSGDTDYFNIIKCLSHYSTLSNDELYKALTRSRKDY